MPAGVGYGDRKPQGFIISLDFITNKRKNKSKKYGDEDEHDYRDEEEEKRMSYADLARKRLAAKKRRK